MIATFRRHLATVGALVLLLACVVLLAMATRSAVRTFLDLQKEVAAALITAFATVIVSLVTIFGARSMERRRELSAELRTKKVPLYESFVSEMFTIFQLGVPPEDRQIEVGEQEARLAAFLGKSTPILVSWASDDVLASWSRFKRDAGNLEPIETMWKFEELLLSIRRDLGHKGKRLQRGDVLGLFVNDVDGYLPANGKQA